MFTYVIPCLLATAAASPLLAAVTKPDSLTTITGNASRFQFYDMPTPAAGPCDLCIGPDGALWGEDIFADIIFRIDPKTHVVEEYPIPFTLPALNSSVLPSLLGRIAFSCAIRPGADGNIYASQGIRNQMVQVNVTTKEVKVFTPPPPNPLGNLQPFNDFFTNASGMFFSQTTANKLTFFDYATEKFTNYDVPGSPLGVFVASDKNVYTTEFLANKMHRLNPQTGETKTFNLPASLVAPTVVRVETHGKYIWFTSFVGDGLGRLNMETGQVVAHTFPSPLAFPTEDTLDSKGNIWFSTTTQNTLNYFTPRTQQFTSIVQPRTLVVKPVSLPFQFEIAVNYGPGNFIYFTEAVSNRVGRYTLN